MIEPQPQCILVLRNHLKKITEKEGSLQLSINTKKPVLSTFFENWKTGRFSGLNWDKKHYN